MAMMETARSSDFPMSSLQIDALLQPLLLFSEGGLGHCTRDQLKVSLNVSLQVFHRGYTADVEFAIDKPHSKKRIRRS